MRGGLLRLVAILILPVLVGLLQFGGLTGRAQVQEAGGVIQPDVLQALQESSEVEVIINLVGPETPPSAVSVDELRQNTAERQGRVLTDLTASDFTLTHQYEVVHALAGRITQGGVGKLAGHADVVTVSIDAELFLALEESVPLIHADDEDLEGIDGSGVVVAVLDTGIDTDHPDLMDSIVGEECFLQAPVTCPSEPHPAEDSVDFGHGTHVSGIITSNGDNNLAPAGVAPNAGIFAYKMFSAEKQSLISNLLNALNNILNEHPDEFDLINMSLSDGETYPSGTCREGQQTIRDNFEFLRANGTLSFAASANNGDKVGISWPACEPSVVAVGAVYDEDVGLMEYAPCDDETTAADQVACFSNSSADLELLAPGSLIISTAPAFPFFSPGGFTSQASPHAVGVAALLIQAVPGLSADQVANRLIRTGALVTDDLDPNNVRSTPRVDARVALLTDDAADFDQDGCTNGQEFGSNEVAGGLRNPLYFWDFFDVPTGDPPVRNGTITIGDLGAVVARFGTFRDPAPSKDEALAEALTPPTDGTSYHTAFDRNGSYSGTDPWHLKPPNGTITVADIGAVIAQFGHFCV